MECPKCGVAIDDSDVKCRECGVDILEERKKMLYLADLPEGENIGKILSRNDDPGFSVTWIVVGAILAAISYYLMANDIKTKGAIIMGPKSDTRSPFSDPEEARKAFEKRMGKKGDDLQKDVPGE